MIKTMFEQGKEAFLPILGGTAGGIGGGFSNWLSVYSNAIWSAVIFAIIGGVLGFWVGKLMQWSHKKICECIDKRKNKKS